jgi:hypothetical protein
VEEIDEALERLEVEEPIRVEMRPGPLKFPEAVTSTSKPFELIFRYFIWLVVWNILDYFSIYWECHHPD